MPVLACVPEPAVALIEPEALDLTSGTLAGDEEVHTVPFLRFHKAFSAREEEPTEPIRDFGLVLAEQERTVMVVHAGAITDFLRKFWNLANENPFGGSA